MPYVTAQFAVNPMKLFYPDNLPRDKKGIENMKVYKDLAEVLNEIIKRTAALPLAYGIPQFYISQPYRYDFGGGFVTEVYTITYCPDGY